MFDLLTADEHFILFRAAIGLPPARALQEGCRLLAQLGFPVDRRVVARELSGGTRQELNRLNLALALMGNLDVLLLDEPYQGFDHGAAGQDGGVAPALLHALGVAVLFFAIALAAWVRRMPSGKALVEATRSPVPG